jgi:retron-type reverse transcriptase
MVLDVVYEQDFKSWSYGFRPGRSAHESLAAMRDHRLKIGGGYALEVDIQDLFGATGKPGAFSGCNSRLGKGLATG